MRIGIFDPYLDDLGGGEKYMMTLAESLSKQHEVYVFWDKPEDLDKIKERFATDISRLKLTKNIFSQKSGFLKRLVETKKYDAIVVLSDGSIPFSLSKKLFIHVQQPLKQFQSTTFKDKFKLSRVDKIFCNSEFTKSYIDKQFGLKTTVMYPPVDLYPQNVKKENIILHVGRFRVKNVKVDDYKKQRVMVETFKKMVEKGLRNWHFVLAVSFPSSVENEFNEMKSSVEGLPVEFLINKTNRELWEIYSKAKLYWHASGFGEDLALHPEYAEHFGISTVEAMGAGAVPVVINAGGQKEIVTDSEDGFLWDTLDQLQEKTLKLTKNDLLWSKMSLAAQKKAEIFSKDRFYKQVLQIIQ